VIGLMPGLGIDNFAHLGGFGSGYLLGRVMVDRPPADLTERRRANFLGWLAGITVLACFALMVLSYLQGA
jgi:hypothetical protein